MHLQRSSRNSWVLAVEGRDCLLMCLYSPALIPTGGVFGCDCNTNIIDCSLLLALLLPCYFPCPAYPTFSSLFFLSQCLLQPSFVLHTLNNISRMFDGCLQYAACSLLELFSNYTSLFLISSINLLFSIKK